MFRLESGAHGNGLSLAIEQVVEVDLASIGAYKEGRRMLQALTVPVGRSRERGPPPDLAVLLLKFPRSGRKPSHLIFTGRHA